MMLIEGPKRLQNLVSSACLAAPAAETPSQDHGPREAWGFAMCFASSQGKPLHSRGEQQGWMPQRRLREAQWFCLDLYRELTVEPGLASPCPAGRRGLAAYPSRETQVAPADCSAEMVFPRYREVSPCGSRRRTCRSGRSSRSLLWEAARRSAHFVW